MLIHILNGDALKNQLPKGVRPCIIMRECLIEGPLDYVDNDEFLTKRRNYFINTYHSSKEEYEQKVAAELYKIRSYSKCSEVCLWFEYDLFCQTNMWYVISQIKNNLDKVRVTWVRPDHLAWTGFGIMPPNRLSEAFDDRVELSCDEIDTLQSLWHHYASRDISFFKSLTMDGQGNLYGIMDAISALIDLYPESGEDRPTRILRMINSELPEADFGQVFSRFSEIAGVYGYGDLQVKRIYEKIQ